ncbi:hypothetical protein [Actinophytocola gossypii]|uniref:hypothetical protein n=1 Tax=Actinophytocola gossypii TaxID=2812003 RepID=UPI0021A8EDB2|nr:hypothetical protein [Actinophytocola gossypii]
MTQQDGITVEQTLAVCRGGSPAPRFRSPSERRRMGGNVLCDSSVSGQGGQSGSMGKDALHLVQFLGPTGDTGGEHGECLSRLVGELSIQAAGQRQRGDKTLPDQFRTRRR